MGFLRSLFGSKQQPEPSTPVSNEIKGSVEALSAFCDDVARHLGREAFASDGMEKQVLSAYAFGGVNVLCQQHNFSPAEGHAISLALLRKHFGYSPADSVANAQALIDATGDRKSSLNGIIHRGIDGFGAWQQDRQSFDASDFRDLLAILRPKPPAG